MYKRLHKIIAISIIVISVGLGGLWMDYRTALDAPLVVAGPGVDFVVKPGMNLTRITQNLAQQGILKTPRYLLWYARLQGNANRINVGEYHIKSGTTAIQLLDQLVAGKVVQYPLTIVEGLSFKQIRVAIQQNIHLEHTLTGLTEKEIMTQLGLEGIHPEGRFLPDTYHFPHGTTDLAFLQRAYDAMDQFLNQAWQDRAVGLPFKTPGDALIMASIVEKETGLASERKAIAGVFIRRLEKRMRLQSDPTVIYGMGDKYKGNIRRKDLARTTPYNTYRNFGLPPTPIAMPGKDAIEATLHPEEGDSLYFVSRGDGSHHFSSTLKEHNQAVIKYQLKGRKRSFSSYKIKQDAGSSGK